MTNLVDADLLLELQERFGDAFAQGLIDHLTTYPSRGTDPECLEVLQMSEIAHRLKDHTRGLIRECRALEVQARRCGGKASGLEREIAMRRAYIVKRDGDGRIIGGLYLLYRSAWHDFMAMFDAYMARIGKTPAETAGLKGRASSRGRMKATFAQQTAAPAMALCRAAA